MEGRGTITERNRLNGQVFNKAQIFHILDSAATNRVLAIKYGVSHTTISKIRNHKIYKKWVMEYYLASSSEIASQLETLENKFPREQKGFYYLDNRYLRISVDDLIITVDLAGVRPVRPMFNTVIKGVRITYDDALKLLRDNKQIEGWD